MNTLTHYAAGGWELDIEPHPVDGFRVLAPGLARALAVDSARNLCRGIPEQEKGVTTAQTPGGPQQVQYLTEAGFYRALGMRQIGRIQDDATRATVEAFQNWVYREVLPNIRATGGYQAAPAKALTNKELALMVIAESDRAEAAEKALEAAKPALDYVKRYVSNDDVITVAAWGMQYGLSQPEAFELLRERGIIYQFSIGERYSSSAGRVVKVYEYRPKRTGRVTRTWEWFDVRPQNNAPRHHNGQVRQTLYVRQAHAMALAQLLNLTGTTTELQKAN
jgi:prophage antirepressor-like protein